ncbi:DUF3710 domain-containing protein [Cellulomonas composti]|uniref:DUF3710 domain-containing protein n=1 Tax=Cellulomonas composti TaxID=266130 RepID=UPI001FE908BC|nr:DUF3710 domain-containing protein [Cellulomonas composti]
MALFRRKTKDDELVEQDTVEQDVVDDVDLAAPDEDDEVDDAGDEVDDEGADEGELLPDPPIDRSNGPWDETEEPASRARVDLGALLVPGVPGMELRMEIDKTSGTVSAATVAIDGSTLQLQAYAAPRTEGIWSQIRAEIRESVLAQGGAADDLPGPFGRELLARLPARTPEGRTGHRPARFLGVDGPRWFLRGVVTGRAAVEPEAARVLEDVFGGVVVVRGTEARPPRDLLALRLPGAARQVATEGAEDVAAADGGADAAPTSQAPSFDPLKRGPEMTETR